jgi:putative oxidoreductase
MDVALLLIRLAVGGTVAAHGAQKVFGWFNGHGIAGTGGFLESLGFRPGRMYAWLLGGAELAGGLALAAGLLTPIAAAVVAGVMLAAIAVVHWQKGFFNMDGGFEFPLALGVGAVAMAFSGAGRWSLDHAFDWALGDDAWGIAAAVVATLACAAVVSSRGIRVHRRSRTRRTATA